MDGIKRIKEMAKGQKEFVLLEIVKYLCSREDMNYLYLNEEKTLKGMASYIQRELIKQYCESYNIKSIETHAKEVKYGPRGAKCVAMGLSEEKTYELAINYFSKSNKELGIKEEKIEKVTKTSTTNNNEKSNDEFGSIFDMNETIENKKDEKEVEQISIFSSIMS